MFQTTLPPGHARILFDITGPNQRLNPAWVRSGRALAVIGRSISAPGSPDGRARRNRSPTLARLGARDGVEDPQAEPGGGPPGQGAKNEHGRAWQPGNDARKPNNLPQTQKGDQKMTQRKQKGQMFAVG
ncbi:MAG: hypothetical protein JXM69_18090 [Anaerolineae bacterium]|nr:hypothetical protein [Anaerolineae bacterium]